MQHVQPGFRRSSQPRKHGPTVSDRALENLSHRSLSIALPMSRHTIFNEPIMIETHDRSRGQSQ
jgi:hypothetical protein